jgi:hypothetical protein
MISSYAAETRELMQIQKLQVSLGALEKMLRWEPGVFSCEENVLFLSCWFAVMILSVWHQRQAEGEPKC